MTIQSQYPIAIATLVIGLKFSRQLFQPMRSRTKTNRTMRDFSCVSSCFKIIARNSDWFIPLFASVVIGRINYFGIGFSIAIWEPLHLLLILAFAISMHCSRFQATSTQQLTFEASWLKFKF